jgi:hypothetical protein
MNIEKVKRYSLIEVVLFAILVIGFLVANMVVKKRANVILSNPIPLFGSGLSVSMPANPGWEHTSEWQYEESESRMTLVGQFRHPSGRGGIEVYWRYLLSTPQGTEKELLEQIAQNTGARVYDLDTIESNRPMTYARMLSVSAGQAEEFYLGVLRLDYNRSLELLVKSLGMNGYYEENLFKSLASSIRYQSPQQVSDGHALIDMFLQDQSQRLPAEKPIDDAFLIKDAVSGANIGYYSAIQSVYTGDEETLQRFEIHQFEYKSFELESALWFYPLKGNYHWQTNLSYVGMKKPQVYQIETDDNGMLSVKCNVKATKTFPAGQFFVPEPLLPELAVRFLQSKNDGVIVDVLGATGPLVPVYLEKISSEKAKKKFEKTDTVVRMVYLYTQNSYEELYFDKSRHLLGKFEQQPRRAGRMWERTSTEELEQLFQTDFQVSDNMTACNWDRGRKIGLSTLNER